MDSSTESVGLLANWWEYWRRLGGSREKRAALSQGEPAEVQAAHDLVENRVWVSGPGAVELLVALNDESATCAASVRSGRRCARARTRRRVIVRLRRRD
jgi:hypothetical protein